MSSPLPRITGTPPTWADRHAELLLRLGRLVMLARRHQRTRPEAYADALGGELLELVAEETAWLRMLQPPEIGPPESIL